MHRSRRVHHGNKKKSPYTPVTIQHSQYHGTVSSPNTPERKKATKPTGTSSLKSNPRNKFKRYNAHTYIHNAYMHAYIHIYIHASTYLESLPLYRCATACGVPADKLAQVVLRCWRDDQTVGLPGRISRASHTKQRQLGANVFSTIDLRHEPFHEQSGVENITDRTNLLRRQCTEFSRMYEAFMFAQKTGKNKVPSDSITVLIYGVSFEVQ